MNRPLPGIHSIAVLRANGLGDLMFALPALDAMRAAYPNATITLLGKPWHAEFLRGRPGPVDEVFVLPDIPGITIPAAEEAGLGDSRPAETGGLRAPRGRSGADYGETAAVREAIEVLRERHFDLALQIFGGGRYSNPFVTALGAAHTVGLQAEDAPPLDMNVPFRYFQSEVFRLLEVAGLAGAAPVTLEPRLEITLADEAAADEVLGMSGRQAFGGRPPAAGQAQAPDSAGEPPAVRPPVWGRLVAIHPSAGDGRRCWPPALFARVARELAERGFTVMVLGSAEERALTDSVAGQAGGASAGRAGGSVIDLGGRLTLGGLAGVLARAEVAIANDSGPFHLARAVGVATVGIFWCGNLITAGPLGRTRHRPILSWRLECPVCGVNCTAGKCEHHESFVAEVSPEEVLAEALSLLGAA